MTPTPTPELRFVERDVYDPNFEGGWKTVRVLQQKWLDEGALGDVVEVWRDVPLVKETAYETD